MEIRCVLMLEGVILFREGDGLRMGDDVDLEGVK